MSNPIRTLGCGYLGQCLSFAVGRATRRIEPNAGWPQPPLLEDRRAPWQEALVC